MIAVIELITNEISRFVPIIKAKNNLLELIRQIENTDESVAVTKNGVPAAVILSMEKYAGLLETTDILTYEVTAKSPRTSIRQARKSKCVPPDQVLRR
jgi:prevent-host-death family protein